MTKRLILVLVSLWWGWTAIIDFVVVPTIFRTISDFFNAGELGIALFAKFNNLEVFLGLLMIILSLSELKNHKTKKNMIQISLIGLCWTLSLTYFLWLTPKIAQLTQIWKEADAAGRIGTNGISDIQQLHQFYHGVYKTLDSVKLLLLTILLTLVTISKEDKVAKA